MWFDFYGTQEDIVEDRSEKFRRLIHKVYHRLHRTSIEMFCRKTIHTAHFAYFSAAAFSYHEIYALSAAVICVVIVIGYITHTEYL